MTESPLGPDPPSGLAVAPGVRIPLTELTWRFSTAGGPGGQHVNTSHTRVEVRFNVAGSPSLPLWARDRIVERLGPVVAVTASDERSQTRNRAIAADRLAARLAQALEVTRPRTRTRPTKSSQRRRLDAKRRHGRQKRDRRFEAGSDDG